MIEKNNLSQRVRAILSPEASRRPATLQSGALAAVLAALAVVPLGLITIDGGGQSSPAKPPRSTQFVTTLDQSNPNLKLSATSAGWSVVQDGRPQDGGSLDDAISDLIDQIEKLVADTSKAQASGGDKPTVDRAEFRKAIEKVVRQSLKMAQADNSVVIGDKGPDVRFVTVPDAPHGQAHFNIRVQTAPPAPPAANGSIGLAPPVASAGQPDGPATVTFSAPAPGGAVTMIPAQVEDDGAVDQQIKSAMEQAMAALKSAKDGQQHLTPEQQQQIKQAMEQAMESVRASMAEIKQMQDMKGMQGMEGEMPNPAQIKVIISHAMSEAAAAKALSKEQMAQAMKMAHDALKMAKVKKEIVLTHDSDDGFHPMQFKVTRDFSHRSAANAKAVSKLKSAIARLSKTHADRVRNAETIAQLKSALRMLQDTTP